MKELELTRGLVALVDDEDYDSVGAFKWHVVGKRTIYARRDFGTDQYVLMHRAIIGAVDGQAVDHVNGNTLDNRRANLRIATAAENCMNRKRRSDCKSRFKGVRFCDRSKCGRQDRWTARIQTGGKRATVGSFKTEIAAAIAYDCAAREHFGPFARLNFSYGAG